MVEMQETAQILSGATSKSLVVLDEIGRGTATFDGLSIAWAVAEHIATNPRSRPKTLFATHYHELTDLADQLSGVANYNVAVKEWDDQVVFLHEIVPGAADKSYGIHVAQLAGVPRSVNDRAREVLSWLESQHDSGEESPIKHALSTNGHATTGTSSTPWQMTLFATEEHTLLDEIRTTNLDELSPREAHTLLQEWQSRLNKERTSTGLPRVSS